MFHLIMTVVQVGPTTCGKAVYRTDCGKPVFVAQHQNVGMGRRDWLYCALPKCRAAQKTSDSLMTDDGYRFEITWTETDPMSGVGK